MVLPPALRLTLDGARPREPGPGRLARRRPDHVTVVASLVSAWVLAGAAWIAHEFYGGSFLGDSLATGAFLWAGFTAARFVTHDAFEARPMSLTSLNIAFELVTVLVMALVIGLVGV